MQPWINCKEDLDTYAPSKANTKRLKLNFKHESHTVHERRVFVLQAGRRLTDCLCALLLNPISMIRTQYSHAFFQIHS